MLVADETEELVLDQRAARRAARHIAVQLGNLLVGGNVGILIEEERSGVQPAGAAMDIGVAVESVAAGLGAHVQVRSGGRALLGVVHGGVDADFFNGLGSRAGNGVADGEIHRSAALDDAARSVVAAARVFNHAGRAYLAGALAVEKVAGVHAVQQKGVRGIALAVGPDGRIAQAGVDARAAVQLRADAGGKNGQPGKAAGRQRRQVDLRVVQNVAVGGVYRVHQRRGFHLDGFAGLADLQRGVHRSRAVGLDRDMLRSLHIEVVGRVSERIGADGQVHKAVNP